MLAGDSQPPNEPSAVRTMLDRPVAQIAAFVTGCVAFWGRATVRPWRTGSKACTSPETAPPPFAWLVTALFTTGVALRVFLAIEAIPPSPEVTLLGDLRMAIGEVSLTGAVLITLPCVLIIALPVTALSRVLGSGRRPDDDPLVAAACHAFGWQFGAVALALAVLIVMQLAGMEPTGRLNDELNAVGPYLIGLIVLWGALLVAPALTRATNDSVFGGVAIGLLGTAPLFFVALWSLGQSVDLQAANGLKEARRQRAWFGDLEVQVLASDPLPKLLGAERHRLRVAYTSHSDRLLIVPSESEFAPADASAGCRYRIVESSLDYLPDRALLIEPGQTRVAEYTVEPQPGLTGTAPEPGNVSYRVPYHRRERDGGFLRGEGELHAPRLGQAPSLRR
ncbi:hypothetical protein MalM25_37270 [Planctomycetes bacterium MalM25]|nr:hypothetical protein MalM25_37270 [Planctomycetes bacterium MalM25]